MMDNLNLKPSYKNSDDDGMLGDMLLTIETKLERFEDLLIRATGSQQRTRKKSDLSSSVDHNITPNIIREIIRCRRMRDKIIGNDLFADPAWDILLDLYAAYLEEREISVSSACIAAAVPPTTALRWLKLMTRKGLLIRKADPIDRRRITVHLSDQALKTVHQVLTYAVSQRSNFLT